MFSKGQALTLASRIMNLLITIVAIATSAILAVSGFEYQSEKLNRWDHIPIPSSEPIEGQNQFYEGVFRARLDHFRPQNQQRVNFVRLKI